MICPRCRNSTLVRESGKLFCNHCGLKRRPNDRVVINRETDFQILKRNIRRTPSGTKVEIMEASPGLRGKYGQLKSEMPVMALRSEPGFIVATSRDQDDLVLLIAEHGWQIDDQKVAETVEALSNDNNA